MPQFDATYFTSQIFWLFLCLIVLACVLVYSAVPRIQRGLNRRTQYVQDIRDREEAYLQQIDSITQRMNALKEEHHAKTRQELEAAHAQMAEEKEKALHSLDEQFSRAHEANIANLKRDISVVQGQIPTLSQNLAHDMMARLVADHR